MRVAGDICKFIGSIMMMMRQTSHVIQDGRDFGKNRADDSHPQRENKLSKRAEVQQAMPVVSSPQVGEGGILSARSEAMLILKRSKHHALKRVVVSETRYSETQRESMEQLQRIWKGDELNTSLVVLCLACSMRPRGASLAD